MKEGNKTKSQLIAELAELRKKAEVLAAQQERIFAILDGIPLHVYLIGTDYLFRYSNRAFQECFGDPEAKTCYTVLYGRTEPCEKCPTFLTDKEMKCEQAEYTDADGHTYRNYFYPYVDGDGNEIIVNLGLDISQQKQAEAALLQSEAKFATAFHCSPDLMAISTLREGRYVEVNDSFRRITGYNRQDTIGNTVQDLDIWAVPEQRDVLLKLIKENRSIRDFELELRLKSGEIRTFCLSGEIIDIDGVPHLLNSSRDITESKRMLDTLRFSEECFSKAFNASPVLMAITSLNEGVIIKVNSAFCRTLKYTPEELIGRKTAEIRFWVDPDDRWRVQQSLRDNHPVHDMEIRFCIKTGEERLGLYSAEPLVVDGEPCILGILTDITELRQIELEMTRLDRLNLVGEMAASLGHEIRNPMTTVRGYLQLLRENERHVQDADCFDLMIEELDSANLIITEFIALAKNKILEMKPTNLNLIISNLMPLIQSKAMSHGQIVKLDLHELPYLLLDPKEIGHLLLNLVNNGLESMNLAGTVIIQTFKQDNSVVLAVQDQGPGINSELLDKLGTPFFTTKGQRTGLGLAVCYRIANRHNAKISVETGSTGTTFYVEFPYPLV